MLKSLLLAGLMFAAALGGMQMANDGIGRMKGYEDPGFEQAISLEKEGSNEVKMAIMGGEVSRESLDEKKEQLEETEAFNLFSSMGKTLASAISGTFRAIIDSLSK
jgi:Protein of unknown function (DUF3679)